MGALLVTIVGGLVVEYTKDFPITRWIAGAFSAFFAWLGSQWLVRTWFLLLLGLFAVAVVVLVAGIGVTRRRNAVARWRNYTRDTFDGVNWYWRYLDTRPEQFVAECPKCSYQMKIDNETRLGNYTGRTTVVCGDCGYEVPFEGTPYELQDRLTKLVQRNLRAGKFLLF